MKSGWLTLAVSLACFVAKAQAPVIYTVSASQGHAGHTITLTGANFGTSTANVAVYFGAVKGTVQTVTNQILEVTVPPEATFENINVTNLTTGLTAYSPNPFQLSYGGTHPFSSANLAAQIDFPATTGLYDLDLCDLDGDGKTDIISVNDSPGAISLFMNATVTVGTISFVKSTLNIGANTLQVRTGDLNGDGKKDVVITEGGNGQRVFILQNTTTAVGSPQFTLLTITLTGKPKRASIADIDMDGKPDIVVTDQGAADFIVVPNTTASAGGAITLGTPQTFALTGAASSDGIAIEDVNGDKTPDIVLNQFLTTNSNILIFENKSTPGNFKFNDQITLTVNGTLVNLQMGDLDGDGKADIAGTQLFASGISVLLNQGGGGTTSFAAPVAVTTDANPWGIEFNDVDGDGKLDILTASITGTVPKGKITILNNESTPGSLSFQEVSITTTFINRHVRAGDLDGDGKPDIAFTSIDDNSSQHPLAASKVSILRNKSCFVPEISPAGPLTICTGLTLHLTSSESPGVTYTWQKNGSTVTTGTTPSLDITGAGAAGAYTVIANGDCNITSNTVNISVAAGSVTAVAPTANTPVCIGSTLTLTANDIGATAFNWAGPASFTATGSPTTRANFTIDDAGRYTVDVYSGTCIAAQESVIVEAIATPSFAVSFSGSSILCSGDTRTLTASPIDATFSYQWYEQTSGLIAGATGTTYIATQTGTYYFKAQSIPNPSCQAIQSTNANIVVTTSPTAAFTPPSPTCIGSIVQFTNQSTVDGQVTPTYSWDFGDGQISGDTNPTHTYTTAQVYTVKLSVSYSGNCTNQISNTITVSTAPLTKITTTASSFSFCPGGSLTLALSNPFNTYSWSTSETTSTIVVTQPGMYSVNVTTSGGCQLTASQQVDTLASPIITVKASPDHITVGETSQLTASGVQTYNWHPGTYLSDSTIANPMSTPTETIVYTVKGKGDNGCFGTTTLTVTVKGEDIVNLLKPSNFFSPNGDQVNNQWTVDNITNYPQCQVSIYDDKGVKVFDAKPYLNSWDGTYHGKPLPDGVYYYIIRCDGEESHPRTGSITILR